MVQDMGKAIKQAAVLRNLIETCLKASTDPMTGRELFDWPSISEQVGKALSGYSRFSSQLSSMVKKGSVERLGKGTNTTYFWKGEKAIAKPRTVAPVALPELKIRINKL